MHKRLAHLALTLALAGACSTPLTYLDVTVQAAAPVDGIDHLVVTVSSPGENAAPQNVPVPNPNYRLVGTYGFALSFSGRSGAVTIDVAAVDKNGATLAAGSAFATLSEGGTSTATVMFGAVPDMGMPDMPAADSSTPDLSTPDLATPDLAMPDLVACVPSLSNAMLGDFTIQFTLTTPAAYASKTAILGQRDVCSVWMGWEVRLAMNGTLSVELDANGTPDVLKNTTATVNDGKPHTVLITRTGGATLRVFIDGKQDGPDVAMANVNFATLPPLVIGASPCDGKDGTAMAPSTVNIADVCLHD